MGKIEATNFPERRFFYGNQAGSADHYADKSR